MIASFVLVLLIAAISWVLAWTWVAPFFGIILPYAAVLIFIGGMIWRMIYWAKSPVPFAIPTTGGQEKSLSFIKEDKIDCPSGTWGVVKRMFMEVFFFRSLFRNNRAIVRENDPANQGPRIIYYSSLWLWCFALIFHYSVLVIVFRHFRFFMEPVPVVITWVEAIDGIMQVGSPRFYWTGGLALCALLFLLCRRLWDHKLRYISLLNDYFPLWLLIGIVGTGICLRYFDKTEISQVKIFLMGLTHFSPVSTAGINGLFFAHITLVCVLLIYFPFSKLAHMPGVFFSPTRNMATDTRRVRHINPWNPPKQFFTYAEYEDEYREAMAEAGLPLEKQPEKAPE
ncbi:MAG: sulfate reduction electron transfer complex DsrMKJOP subunit DsrM [Desulfovibrio sp.]|nr:sulfate reduction electron transfer complex DsrMKJOP subunit DsrM [Desulfovibrio sp.]